MKYGFAVSSVVAAAFVVPAVTLGTQHPKSLEENLLRTVRALESLVGIEETVQSRSPEAIDLVLDWTEPPIATDSAGSAEAEQMLVSWWRQEPGGDLSLP